MAYDLLVKNARIVDGTGTGSFIGDVAVQGETIAAVGTADGSAKRVIDADGLVLAPGFIDTHTHYDGQLFWDPLLSPTSWHGFTTAVIGHCGLTLAPLRERDRYYIAQAFSRVEDIPLDLLQEFIDWKWESYDDYVRP
ncbi:MAG TPA: amidohydrolase family protein [Dehalococcoidia bacterium]|nr:amidohydrolase family protein [Dehalococcoidia bacterium]